MKFPRQLKTLPNGCIQIDGDAPKVRYRTLNFEGHRWCAHRLSYHLNKEPLPRNPESPSSGLVLHKCDNKHCVNPEHLYIGTTEQNMKDCMERSQAWKAWVESLKGKPKSEDVKRKLSLAQSRHQQSLTPQERRSRMAPVQAKANTKAQTPEAKAKRVESMKRYWESLGPEGRRKHVRPALEARGKTSWKSN